MIILERANLLALLREKQLLNKSNIDFTKSKIKEYKYPIGILHLDAISSNKLYEQASSEENLSYFSSITHDLFNDIYTDTELSIINLFLLINCYSYYTLPNEVMNLLTPFINTQSNKIEIQYCLDEIKYRYVLSLIYNNSDQTELIHNLMEELKSIEEEHNKIILDQRKDNEH